VSHTGGNVLSHHGNNVVAKIRTIQDICGTAHVELLAKPVCLCDVIPNDVNRAVGSNLSTHEADVPHAEGPVRWVGFARGAP